MKLIIIDKSTRSILFTGIVANFSKIISALVLFLVLPLAKSLLSSDIFGLWMALSSLLGLLTLLDLGMGNTLINLIAHNKGIANDKKIFDDIFTAYVLSIGIALILIFAWTGWLLLRGNPVILFGGINVDKKEYANTAISLFFIMSILNIPASLVHKLLLGEHKGHISSYITAFSAFCNLLLALIIFPGSPTLITLILCSILPLLVCNTLATFLWFIRSMSWQYVNLFSIRRSSNMLKTSSYFLVIQVVAIMAFQTDSLIISNYKGLSAYGDYAFIQRFFLFLTTISSSFCLGLWPAIRSSVAQSDYDWAKKALNRSFKIGFVASIFFVFLLFIGFYVYYKFASRTEMPDWKLILLFGIWTIIDISFQPIGTALNALGILRPQLRIAIYMGCFAFILKIVLVPALGSSGAILATLISYSIISVPFCLYWKSKIFSSA